MEHRVIKSADFETREEGGKRYLDGYYSVFNQPYEVMPGWIETIAPGAFSKSLREGRDVKVLWNHNSDIVLGSTANGTATLLEDYASPVNEEQVWSIYEGNARVKR